jgi:hypothetical protein
MKDMRGRVSRGGLQRAEEGRQEFFDGITELTEFTKLTEFFDRKTGN